MSIIFLYPSGTVSSAGHTLCPLRGWTTKPRVDTLPPFCCNVHHGGQFVASSPRCCKVSPPQLFRLARYLSARLRNRTPVHWWASPALPAPPFCSFTSQNSERWNAASNLRSPLRRSFFSGDLSGFRCERLGSDACRLARSLAVQDLGQRSRCLLCRQRLHQNLQPHTGRHLCLREGTIRIRVLNNCK